MSSHATMDKKTQEWPAPVRCFSRIIRYTCWGCCVILAVAMILQIVLRTFTSIPVAWTDEVLKISFTWLGLLATVTTLWDNGHIAVDTFLKVLPPKARFIAVIIEHCLTVALMLLLIPYMYDLVLVAAGQVTLTMELPMSILYAAFPFSFALIAIDRVATLYRIIRAGEIS